MKNLWNNFSNKNCERMLKIVTNIKVFEYKFYKNKLTWNTKERMYLYPPIASQGYQALIGSLGMSIVYVSLVALSVICLTLSPKNVRVTQAVTDIIVSVTISVSNFRILDREIEWYRASDSAKRGWVFDWFQMLRVLFKQQKICVAR